MKIDVRSQTVNSRSGKGNPPERRSPMDRDLRTAVNAPEKALCSSIASLMRTNTCILPEANALDDAAPRSPWMGWWGFCVDRRCVLTAEGKEARNHSSGVPQGQPCAPTCAHSERVRAGESCVARVLLKALKSYRRQCKAMVPPRRG